MSQENSQLPVGNSTGALALDNQNNVWQEIDILPSADDGRKSDIRLYNIGGVIQELNNFSSDEMACASIALPVTSSTSSLDIPDAPDGSELIEFL